MGDRPVDDSRTPPVSQTAPYPASTKQIAGVVDGLHTDLMSVAFADKIMITITQEGRLAQWIQVPLTGSPTSSFAGMHVEHDTANALLPRSDLTAFTILGGTVPERQTVGQLLATQIGTAILTKNPEESRTLVLGLGLKNLGNDRDAWFSIIDLVLQCL